MADAPIWNLEAGGIPFDDDLQRSSQQGSMRPPRGMFAEVPGYTPKYARNDGSSILDDYREQMARLFLQVTDYKAFVNSFQTDPNSQQIAKVLGGTVSQTGQTNGGNGYIDFLLQNVQHSFQEKYQVIETLADDHVAYFFGQGAPTFSYAGTLINTKQDDQAMGMLRLYRDMGRGLKLAQRNTLLSIRYDGLLVSGAMLNLSLGLNAETETAVPFSFNLLVKQLLLLPNQYASVVQLTTPFATSSLTDQYQPFALSLTDPGTTQVNIVAAPPISGSVTPAATPVSPAPPTQNLVSSFEDTLASNVSLPQ